MNHLGWILERKILHESSLLSIHHLPTPYLFATVITQRPEHPRVSQPLKVKAPTAFCCDISICLSVSVGREVEPTLYLLMLPPSECSWVIVFHNGRDGDLMAPARCELEKVHIAYLWFTPGSRWKWCPRSALISVQRCLVWRTYGVRICSLPWLWLSQPACNGVPPNRRESQEQSVPFLPSTPSPSSQPHPVSIF
jgi:hypothetical protein